MLERTYIAPIVALSCLLAAGVTASAERQMSVYQGPETVFAEPVAELFSELAGATQTDSNGRVGNEFVFWGYTLSDGRDINLFACALLEGVDCEERKAAMCLGTMQLLAQRAHSGTATNRKCREVAITGLGDLHPGCTDIEFEATLTIGIAICR